MKELEKLIKIKSYSWANILINLVSQYTSNDKYFRFLIDSMEREGIKLEQIVVPTLTLALQTQSGDVVRRLVSFLENSEHKQHISPEQLFNTLKSKLSFVNIIQSLAKNPNMDLINEFEFLALRDAKFSRVFKKAIKAANYHAIREAVSNPNPKVLEMLQPYAAPQNSKMKKIEKDIQRVILLESAIYEDTQVFQERYREFIQNGDKVDWVFFMEALRNESAENAIFLAKEMGESELIKIISEHAYFLLRSALRNKNTECLKWLLSEGFKNADVDLALVLSDGSFAIFAVAAKNENPEMVNILFDIAKKIQMSEKHTLYNIAIMCEAYAIYIDARYTKIAGMIWEDAPLEWRILSNKRLNISGASSVDSINYDMAKWLIQRDIQVNNEIMEFDWRIAHIVLEYRSLFNKHTIYNHISAPIVSSIQMLIYKESHEMQPEVGSQLMLMFIQRHILEIMDSGTDKGFKLGFMPQTVYSTAASLVIYLAGRDDITHEQIHRTIKESYKLSLYEKYIQDLNLYSDGYYHTIFTIRELSFIRSGLRLEAFEILKACAVTEQISSEKEVLDIVKREAMHYLYHDVVLLLPKLSYIPNKIIMEFLVGKLQEETFTHIIGVTKFPLVGIIPSDFSIAGYIKYNNGRGLSFYQDLHKIFGDKTFDLLTERYLNEQERENIYFLATKQLSKIMKINTIVEHLMQAPYKTSFSKIIMALDPKAQAQSDYNMKYQLLMSIKFHFIIRAINEAENIARMYNIDIDTTEMLYDTLLQREQNDGEHIAILQPQQNFSQDRGFNDSGERINPMQINVNEELYDQNMFFAAIDYFSNL